MKTIIVLFGILSTSQLLYSQDEVAGTLSIKSFTINYHTTSTTIPASDRRNDSNPTTAISVEKVTIHVVEGTIRKIIVKCGPITFTNRAAPISLTRFESRIFDALQNKNNDKQYIYVDDIIGYDSETEANLIPNDTTFSILSTSSETSVDLKKSSMLKIDLRAFSDLQGVSGKEANGLVQLEGSLKIIVNTQNAFNVPLFVGQYIQPYFGTAKFDSKFSKTYVDADNNVNRMDVFQRSPFTFGVKANLVKYYTKAGHTFEVKAGYQFNRSDIVQVVDNDSTTLELPLNSFLIQAPISFRISRNIFFNYTPSILFQQPTETESTSFVENLGTNTLVQNEFLLAFSVSKENNLNKVFLRFNLFSNLTEKGHNFTQLQLGYERSLSDLLSKLSY